MSIFQAFILGIIQGVTEFLPISSSAHLVLFPYLLNWHIPENQIFPFDVLVQMGTIIAVIIYFWKDLVAIIIAWVQGLVRKEPFKDINSRMGWYLILATIPAGLVGLFLKDIVEKAFGSPVATAWFLFFTAGLLLIAEYLGRRNRSLDALTWKDALWIGCFQIISIFPGVSRSGSTIAGGMTRNLNRRDAGRFSFLMSIPVMLAAGLLSMVDLMGFPGLGSFLPTLLIGLVTSAVVGYLSIRWLLSYISRHSLVVFSIYCALLGALVLFINYVPL